MTTVIKHIDFESPAWGEFAEGPQARPGYHSEVLADEPSAWWRLGETSGSVALDEVGSSDGAYAGVTLGTPGALEFDSDAAAQFSGLPQQIAVSQVAAISSLGQAGTLEAWCRLDGAPSEPASIFDLRGIGNSPLAYLLQINPPGRQAGQVRLTAGVPGGGPYYDGAQLALVSQNVIAADAWTHIVAVYDQANSRIYINGQDRTESIGGSFGTLPTVNNNTMRIGRHGLFTQHPFVGRLDELAIYPHALSAERVRAHYLAGVGQ